VYVFLSSAICWVNFCRPKNQVIKHSTANISSYPVVFFRIYFHSRDMTVTLYKEIHNKTYYYSIHDQQQLLFDGYEFTAAWGVNLSKGRVMRYHFRTRREMAEKFRTLMNKRKDDGYRLLYTFSRKSKNDILSTIILETAGVS
jgi:predicted DNA-binding WGR domain protein